MFGRNKEQSLGDMLKSPEAPKPVEQRAETSFDDWDKKAEARGEWASKKAGELKEKASQLWGGLKDRVKKGAGYAMTAPEMAVHAAGNARESVSEKMADAANIDYDRNTAADGGKLENFLASLDDKRDDLTAGMSARYDSAKEATAANYEKFKSGFYDKLDETKDGAVRVGQKIEAGSQYVANRTEHAYSKFSSFLKYHSPAQRRARATEATQQQVESLHTERAVTNVSAQELMQLLKNCEKFGVPVGGIKIEIGNFPEDSNREQEQESEMAAAA